MREKLSKNFIYIIQNYLHKNKEKVHKNKRAGGRNALTVTTRLLWKK